MSILASFEGIMNEETAAPLYHKELATALTEVMFGIGSA